MKKIIITASLIFFLGFTNALIAHTDTDVSAANFLASKDIINDSRNHIPGYMLGNHITRREMLKVMMNLSEKTFPDRCTGRFQDMRANDWGCKYAEAALANGYITANPNFRPDDLVTQIEALKMIMQAKGIEQQATEDWRLGYVRSAQEENIISEQYLDFNLPALRAWIFTTSARTYDDFQYSEPEYQLTPEEEELFRFLLDL
ncbi:S-layer homology domain-containing protein [Candidatus Gracilibacteria bacterium]|nr:S-layer homology domain-containing protein [Candidatus Gracilibacteria bacterium]